MIVGTGVAEALAKLFATISTHNTYPLLVAVYSAVLGVFIPSGGSKWIVEAPYVLQAANLHQVHLGWVVQIYNASEAPAEPDQPVLDAAAAGDFEIEGTGYRGLRNAAAGRARAGGVFSMLVVCAIYSVCCHR